VPLCLSVDLALQHPDYVPDYREDAAPERGEGAVSTISGTVDWLNISWEPEEQAANKPVEKYVGLENFSYVLGDPKFHKALKNTSLYVLVTIGIALPLAFFLAHFLRQVPGLIRPVLSFLLLLPGLCLSGVLATLFQLFFHGREGALNQWLVTPMGLDPINWLLDPSFVLPALVLQAVWRWTGFIVLFFLCGMEAIPNAYYEAAKVEGANTWRVMRSITFPAVRHVAVFAAVFLIIDGFASFSGAYNLLGGSGGILDSGLLLVTYLYQVAFPGGSGQFDFPAAAAMSLLVVPLTALVLFLVLFGRNRLFKA